MIKEKDVKDNIDYKFTNDDLPLLDQAKMLTVKKSDNYYIFTYYGDLTRNEMLDKYEVNANPDLLDRLSNLESVQYYNLTVDTYEHDFLELVRIMQQAIQLYRGDNKANSDLIRELFSLNKKQ